MVKRLWVRARLERGYGFYCFRWLLSQYFRWLLSIFLVC